MKWLAVAGGCFLVVGPVHAAIVTKGSLADDYHGARQGAGFSGPLLAPYVRGAATPCGDCHTPHGGTNRARLRSSVNGRAGISVTDGNSAKNLCAACHQGDAATWHQSCVTQCHADPPPGDMHPGFGLGNIPGDAAPCLDCHGHGKDFTHTGTCLGCHGTLELSLLGVDGPYDVKPFAPWTYHTF
ncbi:MAG: hypothetical protein HY908_32005 [Myxococcales bacterium]|nr:hypothetical protein [Myxococcales bacterium]